MLNGDEYITMQLEEGLNAYGIWNVPPEISYDRNFVDFYNYSQNTDWIGKITKDSYTHDHFFNMSGGGRKSMYYTSVNYQKASGTTVNTAFRRLGIRANFNYSISNKLRITTYFSYSNTLKQDNPSISGRNVREMAYIKAPNMSIWEYDQDGELTGEYFTPILSYQGSGSSYYNPVAIADLGKNDTQGNEIQNNFIVDYNILDWLKFKESISFAYINEKGNSFTPASAIGADWLYSGKNNAREKNDINLRLLSRSQLFITPLRSSRDHSLIGVLMWEMEQKKFESMDIVTGNGPTIKIKDPSVGAPTDWMWSGSSQIRLFGAFGSLNYKYKNRYLLSASIRADGSSMFGESNQWGVFPSLSAGWKFSEEGFLSQYAFLNESKLRLSWGRSGKGISEDDPYARYSYYITQGRYMLDPSIVPGQIQLASLKWQTVESWNLGLDLNFFNNRLYVKGDVYDKITFDLLWNDYDIPGTTGYNELEYFNGGSISNRGWEFYTRGVLIDREKLLFSLNFNISQNINRFISFPENFKKQRGISISNGEFPKKAEIGKPIGSFYGFRYLGVYPSDEHAVAKDENGNILVDANGEPIPMTYMETYEFKGGDAIYEDINHDGKIDLMDVVYIGDSSPLFIGGFGSTLKYKSFGISLNFHYRLGFDIINKVAIETEGMLNKNNQSKAVLHRWKREGQEGEGMLPRAYMNHPANNLGSDRYVEPGDFLRLNTINFTYRLNPRLAKRMNLSSLEIGIMIRKLLTFTNYTGQDPEIGRVGLDPFWLGLDEARTPAPKEYSLRFNLNF
jgi:TonB-linked SusC/RagA family outer membrane protein